MKKCILLFSVLCMVSIAGIFADEENSGHPKNTITIDTAMPYATLLTWSFTYDPFFGTAVQYERDLGANLSLAARASFIGMWILGDTLTNLSSFSAETHGRYYPNGEFFFVDWSLGYANFTLEEPGKRKKMANYVKTGVKVGWRIDFGEPGGFVLEPGIGFYQAFGPNREHYEGAFSDLNNYLYNILARAFVSGFNFSLGMGCRF